MTIKKVLDRMWNWKCAQAYNEALITKAVSEFALFILKDLSDKFGDCGWQDGSAFEILRINNQVVAGLLGYEANEGLDDWVKMK